MSVIVQTISIAAALAMIPAVNGCHSHGTSVGDWSIDERASPSPVVDDVRTALRRFETDDSSGDADRIAAWYVEDAVWQPVRGSAVHGREAIRERYRQAFATDQITVRILEDGVCVRGSLASVAGRTHVTIQPRSGGDSQTLVDRFIMLMRKDGDRWRVTALAWEPDEQPATNGH